MSKVVPAEIHYAGKVDSIFLKRLKYTQQIRLFATMNEGSHPSVDNEGKPVLDKDGNQEITRKPESMANYQIGVIVACVCDKKGNPVLKFDDVDSWTEEDDGAARILAYVEAASSVNLPTRAEVVGNSKPTVTDSSSSASPPG